MTDSKTAPTQASSRTETMQRRVLEAAERLLRTGRAAFSMRELAAEAGVSFATPFNQFGSKAAIMHALSAQRISAMVERFSRSNSDGDAADRVFIAVEIAASVMLEEPGVNRAVMGTLGSASEEPGQVYAQSQGLWAHALGTGRGLASDCVTLALSTLPDQLAVAFRGVLSFWTAGEISDAELAPRARAAAAALLLGFVDPEQRHAVLASLRLPRA